MNISSPKTNLQDSETPVISVQNQNTSTSISTSKRTEDTKSVQDNEVTEKKDDKAPKEQDFKKVLEAEKNEKEKAQLEKQNHKTEPGAGFAPNTSIFNFDLSSQKNNLKNRKFDFTMNFDTASISKDDAKFFIDMVENKQFAVQGESPNLNMVQFADEMGPSYKTQPMSNVLQNLIEKAYTDNKPVRIDFDNNISIIMKIDKKGKVTAEFIPGDKAVEEYLRNNLRVLKNRFDEQNLPYNDLFYRQNRNQNKEKQQNNNKGD